MLTLLIIFFLIFFFCSVLEMLADPIKYEAKQHEARQKRKKAQRKTSQNQLQPLMEYEK